MLGPGDAAFVSTSRSFGLGEDVGPEASLVCPTGGGGSITECAGDFGTTGSGRAGIPSSAEEVSIVIYFVGGGAFRGV